MREATAASLPRPALWPIAQRIAHHAWPVLIGQMASIGMSVSDTIQMGHHGRSDLAAVAVGSAVFISVMITLSAIAPSVAQLKGGDRPDDIGRMFQQGMWLALFLSLLGSAVLACVELVLSAAPMSPEVRNKAEVYLHLLAMAVPGMLMYRAVFAFNQALDRPRPMMTMNILMVSMHVPLSWALVNGVGPWPAMGSAGCGMSSVLVSLVALAMALAYVARQPFYAQFHLFKDWQKPQRRALGKLARIGLPIGLSNLVEITSFALISVFLASLSTEVVVGHRVIASLHTLLFMLSLSLGTSTLVHVGGASGIGPEIAHKRKSN